MNKTWSGKLLVLFILGLFVTGCSSLPATRDVTAKKPAQEKGMSVVEYLAQDEPVDTNWD